MFEMKKFKEKFRRHVSDQNVSKSAQDVDFDANPTIVRDSTYSESSIIQGQATEESEPWGLKELFPGKDPVVDIVAVHGLNGHRERTWTFESGTEKDGGVLWLRDLLPAKLPNARIWTWGYDSRTHSRSHQDHLTTKRLYDHGRELVFDLDSTRRESNSHQRPIIFVAHSLGGIVVKSALLHSDRVREGSLEEQRSVKLSTYGIIFMGTPHQGGQGVGIGRIMLNIARIQGDTSDNMLKHLEENSELLQQQISEFSLISQVFDIQFAYETKPTPIVGGIAREIVPKWSAVISGAPNATEFGINADHRRMTKFPNAESQDFKKMARTLKFMIQKASEKVKDNWASEERIKQVPEGRRRPVTLRHERDTEFVGRTDIIAELDQKFTTQRRVVLAGIGGVGKSQIAIEYCYRFRERNPDASVFWVHAGTVTRFKQAYEEISKDLDLVGKDDPTANILQLVADWLSNEDHGVWLMILDNADDQEVFDFRSQAPAEIDKQLPPLHHYLPQSSKGSIIITTRDKRVGERLAFRKKGTTVPSFDEQMAKTLLRSKVSQDTEWNEVEAVDLVKDLEYLPLAITQAAAFISENSITIKDYLETLRADDSGLVSLLDRDLIDLRRDFDASSSIIRTWQVSFNQIRKENKRAAELLSLMAVLDRQGIPKELLCREDEQPLELTVALGTLGAFSLISSDKERTSFEMHRLVQVSTLRWLEMQNEKLKWQEEALRILDEKFPNGNFETWETCALYLPHVNTVVDSLTLKTDHVNEFDLFLRTAEYLIHQGQYRVPGEMLQQVSGLYEKAWGKEHEQTLRCEYIQVRVLEHQGHYEEAERLCRQNLRLKLEILGEKHQETLDSSGRLASILNRKGKYEEAREMQLQTLSLTVETFGKDHFNTIAAMNGLALIYYNLGQWIKAQELYVQIQVLELSKKISGEEHPITLISMSNLASTYAKMGKLDEAETLQIQVLKWRKKGLGEEHPDTLISMGNLAWTYAEMGKLDEAETLEVQRLELSKKILGEEHPSTLISMSNLAWTWKEQNQLEKAISLMSDAVKLSEAVLGVDHHYFKDRRRWLDEWLKESDGDKEENVELEKNASEEDDFASETADSA